MTKLTIPIPILVTAISGNALGAQALESRNGYGTQHPHALCRMVRWRPSRNHSNGMSNT